MISIKIFIGIMLGFAIIVALVDFVSNGSESVIGLIFTRLKQILTMKLFEKKEETPIEKATKLRSDLLETWVTEYISAGMDPKVAMRLANNKLDAQVKEQFKEDVEKYGRGLW